MGIRPFELGEELDEDQLLATGMVPVDSIDYPVARRIPYTYLRRPTRSTQQLFAIGRTLVPNDNGAVLTVTVALTMTVPLATILGVGFRCWIYADGVAVTVTRSGGGTVTLSAGELLTVLVANGKIVTHKQAGAAVL